VTYLHRCCASEGGLVQDGPLVKVRLSPPRIQAEQMSAKGKKVPSVAAKLMLDTGAAKTAIDNDLAAELNLVPIRFEQVVGVSQESQECPVYLLVLRIDVTQNGKKMEYSCSTEALGIPSPRQGEPYSGFIGRDFLAFWRLTYDGPSGVVEMQIEP
jgi:predicted aspartyl protease